MWSFLKIIFQLLSVRRPLSTTSPSWPGRFHFRFQIKRQSASPARSRSLSTSRSLFPDTDTEIPTRLALKCGPVSGFHHRLRLRLSCQALALVSMSTPILLTVTQFLLSSIRRSTSSSIRNDSNRTSILWVCTYRLGDLLYFTV